MRARRRGGALVRFGPGTEKFTYYPTERFKTLAGYH